MKIDYIINMEYRNIIGNLKDNVVFQFDGITKIDIFPNIMLIRIHILLIYYSEHDVPTHKKKYKSLKIN